MPILKDSIEKYIIGTNGKLLDIRPITAHYNNTIIRPHKYIKGSYHIPLKEFEDRFCELPTKNIPFSVLINGDEAEEHHVNLMVKKGWCIEHIFYSTDEFWKTSEDLKLVDYSTDGTFQYRNILFSPCGFLDASYDVITKGLEENFPKKWDVMDIGCGSGRDLVWLCIKNNKFRINGIDNLKRALNRTRILATNLNVNERLGALLRIDFLKDETFKHFYNDKQFNIYNEVKELIPALKKMELDIIDMNFSLVICVRYLERSCFKHIRNMVKLNGYILYSTFIELGESLIYSNPTKESGKRLNRGELANEFGPNNGFEILIDKIEFIEDGRPVNSFLAKRVTS